jgi:Na+-driven multidrug efflux pump
MYTGTTNLVASAQETDRGTADKPRTTKTLIGAMQLSTFVGAGLGTVLFVFARPLLSAIIGNGDVSPAIFGAAMKYVRIRALGMPAAAIIGSTQAACLGMQDIRSPLYVLAAAAVVNFFGDMIFVSNAHPLLGGAAGAAWATVISQYAGVALFIRWLCNKPEKTPQVMNVSKAILEITGKPSSEGGSRRQRLRDTLQNFNLKRDEKKRPGRILEKLFNQNKTASGKKFQPKGGNVTVRGFLQNKFSSADLVKPPSAEIRKEFAPYLLPVTTTQVGRVSGYVAMSHVVASSLGTVSMAAQQVIVSLFYCLCPIADSLSLTAQSFIPSISEKPVSAERAAALRRTSINFVKAGAIFGVAMMAAVSAIPLLSGFFTSDPIVVSMVNSVVPMLLAFFGLHGVLCSTEGVLLGQKDLSFVGKMYGGYFFAVPYLMLRVKKAALSGSPVNLTSVWSVFLIYQMFRFVAWLSRVVVIQRRTEIEAYKAAQYDP